MTWVQTKHSFHRQVGGMDTVRHHVVWELYSPASFGEGGPDRGTAESGFHLRTLTERETLQHLQTQLTVQPFLVWSSVWRHCRPTETASRAVICIPPQRAVKGDCDHRNTHTLKWPTYKNWDIWCRYVVLMQTLPTMKPPRPRVVLRNMVYHYNKKEIGFIHV